MKHVKYFTCLSLLVLFVTHLFLGALFHSGFFMLRPSLVVTQSNREFGRSFKATCLGLPLKVSGSASLSVGGVYGDDALYKKGDFGQGIHIALIEFATPNVEDISSERACIKRHNPHISFNPIRIVRVDHGSNAESHAQDGAQYLFESEVDLGVILSLAPEAQLTLYVASDPHSASNVLAVYRAAIGEKSNAIVNISFGVCEQEMPTWLQRSESKLFTRANSNHQVVVASSGDFGANDCLGPPQTGVQDPASQPDVLAVGGTVLRQIDRTIIATPWPQTGRGSSNTWGIPQYQQAVLFDSKSNQTGRNGCHRVYGCREVPDVVADAGSPVIISCNVPRIVVCNHGFVFASGTSVSAPIWAAQLALARVSSTCVRSAASNFFGDLYSIKNFGRLLIQVGPKRGPTVPFSPTTGLGSPRLFGNRDSDLEQNIGCAV